MVPVLRFPSAAERARACEILEAQQFDVRHEAECEVSCSPWEDLDDAFELLHAEGIRCERAERAVPRLGPRVPGR